MLDFSFKMPKPSRKRLAGKLSGFKPGNKLSTKIPRLARTENVQTNTEQVDITERELIEPIVIERRLRDKTVKNDQIVACNDGNIRLGFDNNAYISAFV